MLSPKVQGVRRARREALIHAKIAEIVLRLGQGNALFQGISISRVKLSPDGKLCTIYVMVMNGLDSLPKVCEYLKRRLPSFRKTISQSLPIHRLPNMRFVPDVALEEHQRVSAIIDQLKESGNL